MKAFYLILTIFSVCCGFPAWIHGATKLILDTDMASDCDDAGALAVLNALADLDEVEILAVVTNLKGPGNASAAAVDAINTYYGRPDVPIGTDKDGAKVGWLRTSRYTGVLRDQFTHDSQPDDSMPDALDVYRQVLSKQEDGSVTICSVGAFSNLEDLLNSKPDKHSSLSGHDLVARKVRQLVVMGGGFPRSSKHEFNVRVDPAAAFTVANLWPGPILWQGFEVGFALYTGAALKTMPDSNPVRRAFALRPFRGGFAIDHGKPSHDQATVLLAVRGAEQAYWSVSESGRVVVDSRGMTEWIPQKKGQHQFVTIACVPTELEHIISDLMIASPTRN